MSSERGVMTTWRVIWGKPFPKWHDFWAEQPASHYAEIKRQLGMRDVTVTSFEENA